MKTRYFHLPCALAIGALAALFAAGPSFAVEEHKQELKLDQKQTQEQKLPDTFELRLGGYHTRNANTIVRLDTQYNVGAYVNFKDTLGGETSTTVFRADGVLRFNENHSLSLGWYALKFKGSRTFGRDFQWGDQTIDFSRRVDSEIKYDVYKLNYRYSLFHNKEAELGLSLGAHIMRVSASIRTEGGVSEGQAITAPLPMFGVFGNYNFTPAWSIYYTHEFFFVSYDNKVQGGVSDMLMGTEYRFKYFGLGAALNRYQIALEAQKNNRTLSVDSHWSGILFYGTLFL